MPAYGDAEYWDARYAAEPGHFEWYLSWPGLSAVLQRHIAVDARVMQLGVGLSVLQAQMVEQGGYQDILSVDISSVAISHLQQAHAHLPQLRYQVADIRSMPEFADASFDALIDKGTLDALLCSPAAAASAAAMMDECRRVLAPGGTLTTITYGDPGSRVHLFRDRGWQQVSFYVIGRPQQQQPAAAAAAGAPGGTQQAAGGAPSSVHGPHDVAATTQAALEAFSITDDAYFVYVCTKPEASEEGGGGGPAVAADVAGAPTPACGGSAEPGAVLQQQQQHEQEQ